MRSCRDTKRSCRDTKRLEKRDESKTKPVDGFYRLSLRDKTFSSLNRMSDNASSDAVLFHVTCRSHLGFQKSEL